MFISKQSSTNKNVVIQVILHLFGAVFLVLSAGFLLVGLYHVPVFLIMKVATPVFMKLLPTITLILALGVIFFKQPVYNLLCLIAVFFNTAILYIYVGAEFLAFLFLIVYVGAVMILFLFTIMLLHLKETAKTAESVSTSAALVAVLTIAVIAGIDDTVSHALSVFFVVSDTTALVTETNSVEVISWFIENQFSDVLVFSFALYTEYAHLFVLISLLLLTAMLGAIILATNATDE